MTTAYETDDGTLIVWGSKDGAAGRLAAFNYYIETGFSSREISEQEMLPSLEEFDSAAAQHWWAPKGYNVVETWDQKKIKSHWWPGYVPFYVARW